MPGLDNAAKTSSFKIFPCGPVAVTVLGSTFLSAIIAEATGLAFISAGRDVTGAVDSVFDSALVFFSVFFASFTSDGAETSSFFSATAAPLK